VHSPEAAKTQLIGGVYYRVISGDGGGGGIWG